MSRHARARRAGRSTSAAVQLDPSTPSHPRGSVRGHSRPCRHIPRQCSRTLPSTGPSPRLNPAHGPRSGAQPLLCGAGPRWSTTLENEAIVTGENEAAQTDWMGDLGGGLGLDSAAGRGWCSAAAGRTGSGGSAGRRSIGRWSRTGLRSRSARRCRRQSPGGGLDKLDRRWQAQLWSGAGLGALASAPWSPRPADPQPTARAPRELGANRRASDAASIHRDRTPCHSRPRRIVHGVAKRQPPYQACARSEELRQTWRSGR